MRVLIAGRDRRIGSELVGQLEQVAEVVAPSRRDLDLTDADAIIGTVRTHAPDLIINTAACGARPDADPDTALPIYAHAPRVLAEEAERLDVPLLHYSTDQLFDGNKETPYVEDDDPSPQTVVGRAQLLGERAILGSASPFLLIRVAWIYRIRDVAAKTSLEGGSTPWSPQSGSPTWGRHVASATAQTLEALVGARGLGRDRLASGLRERGGVFHMAAQGQTDEQGFRLAVARLAAADQSGDAQMLEDVGDAVGSLKGTPPTRRNRELDTGKLARELGIRLPTWEEGLLDGWADLAGQRTALTV